MLYTSFVFRVWPISAIDTIDRFLGCLVGSAVGRRTNDLTVIIGKMAGSIPGPGAAGTGRSTTG